MECQNYSHRRKAIKDILLKNEDFMEEDIERPGESLTEDMKKWVILNNRELFFYLDRTRVCYSLASFSWDPHKVYHHGPLVG